MKIFVATFQFYDKRISLYFLANEINKKNVTNLVFTSQVIGGLASKFIEIKRKSSLKSQAVSFEPQSLLKFKNRTLFNRE